MAGAQGPIFSTGVSNTPAILTPSSGDTIMASNTGRIGYLIQNLGTNPLFVRLGAGATTSVFHVILQAGTGADNGTGGILSQENGVVYYGDISVAGTSPRCVVTEFAP